MRLQMVRTTLVRHRASIPEIKRTAAGNPFYSGSSTNLEQRRLRTRSGIGKQRPQYAERHGHDGQPGRKPELFGSRAHGAKFSHRNTQWQSSDVETFAHTIKLLAKLAYRDDHTRGLALAR